MPTTVTIECVVKEVFDASLKSGLVTTMRKAVEKVIDTRSGGKLTTSGKSDDAITLTVTLDSLKADNKAKPAKLEAAVSFKGVKLYPSSKTYKSSKPATGAAEGVGSNLQAAANGLLNDILDWEQAPMKTVMKALLSL